MKEEEALVRLASIPHLGSIKIRLLIQRFGTAAKALQADLAEIRELPGFGEKILENWQNENYEEECHANLKLVAKWGAKIIPYTSPEYPQRLLEIPDYPILLYVKGNPAILNSRSIAIVGTRQSSIYGNEMAEKISQELASWGFVVVSGLARGIDTAAHRGALRGGKTIAVIGSGLADIYPQENKPLAQAIAENGALVSEFPMNTPPDRQNFPQRNRIVSGMTLGTVLVEAPKKSGAMITMERAATQKRRLFALPGRADQENFRGNHFLIKTGQAQLIESAEEIAKSFDDLFSLAGQPAPVTQKVPLEVEEEKFLQQLPVAEISFDEMMRVTQLPVHKLNVLLMSLIVKKMIKEFPGKVYKKR